MIGCYNKSPECVLYIVSHIIMRYYGVGVGGIRYFSRYLCALSIAKKARDNDGFPYQREKEKLIRFVSSIPFAFDSFEIRAVSGGLSDSCHW